MNGPTGFLGCDREDPPRRPVEERLRDFNEIYPPAPTQLTTTQASRCMDCGVPFCQSATGCPLHNLIPEWNDLATRGRWREALDRLHATNNFPEFTGRLCPAPCESACVLGLYSDPVTIKAIEQKIIDVGFEQGWIHPLVARTKTGFRIAIVGSGPAGLASAQQLVRAGYEVTVFEKASLPGGLLRYGIPDFKMEKSLIDRRIDQLEQEGVVFKTGVNIGVDISVEQLLSDYDSVCLTIGAEVPRDLRIPGRELSGIHFAMDYLVAQNDAVRARDGRRSSIDASGKHVIILGGGDTGSDCLGTALRQGARSVHQFEIQPEPPHSRSTQTPWPEWPVQLRISHAHEEGGRREFSMSTKRFLGHEGHVQQLVVDRLNDSIKQPHAIAADQTTFDADLVLLALGFTGPRTDRLIDGLGVELDARGNIKTGTNFMTSREGLFAAGDARKGASLIVWAIAEGRKMALGVDHYIKQRSKVLKVSR